MKKFFALMLVLLTLLMAGTVLAEAPFEGVWVQFEEGFEVLLPAEWLEIEVTEDMAAQGVFYVACSEDGEHLVQMMWSPLETEMTAQEVQAELVTEYTDAEVLEINGIEFISLSDEANDLFCLCALDGAEPGLYMFWFSPNSDETFVDTAVAIATSIRNIE